MFSQAPVIEGDQYVCINTDGIATITNNVTYDSYQWYSKFTFEEDTAYLPITGATTSTFSYNFMMSDYTIKVITTLNGNTFESNAIDLETIFDLGLYLSDTVDGEYYVDDFGIHLCEGSTITFTAPEIYSENLQWFKNDILLENETTDTLVVTEPGTYHARSSREFCPLDYSYSLPLVILVEDCTTADIEKNKFENSIQLYPNPTKDQIFITNLNNVSIKKYEIYSIDGKKLNSKEVTDELKFISLENLASGSYLIKFYGENQTISRKIIKK